MVFTKIVSRGTRAVMIYANDTTGPFYSRLYVNCGHNPDKHRLQDASITLINKTAKTLKGAEKQAERMLA